MGDVTYYYETGDVYIGQFQMGYRCGKGTLHYASGDTYTGDWDKDKKHGGGVYNF